MTRDEFILKKSKAALWDVAVSINRTNPLPIDSNSVFFTLEDAQQYINENPVAYAGQIIAVVGEDSTNIYYTQYSTDGALELASIASSDIVDVDNGSIQIVDEKIQIKNFGDHYYKFIEEYTNTETDEVVAAHYELTSGFKTGLEPKVAKDGDNFIIEWYEPAVTADKVVQATDVLSGISKLYSNTGNNEDGSMTQKSITAELHNIQMYVSDDEEETLVISKRFFQ